ncbi:immunity 52 family protein [Burkholderia pseudomallei]|uniref:immunity 52 family protein n=1 Tax=Burkholderia pseudomallei TaxID=28450 RepID=UPI0010529A0A|nr:immunity 52 family protein [Burkholderia pseudomallei]QBL81418.1 hypothetical protein EYA82_28015 [Burkholderia pseudomallei]
MEINTMFRDVSLSSRDFSEMLSRESKVVAALAAKSPLMAHANWRLKGNSLEEATLYPAFDADGSPSTPALAVLNEEQRGKKHSASHAAIWKFDDKPGVGWMLYLPKVITQQQVPEARALIPVPAKGKQTGTIIVSVTDAPFSVDNPEHVAIANRIEIRLVDQDLLPAYVDI